MPKFSATKIMNHRTKIKIAMNRIFKTYIGETMGSPTNKQRFLNFERGNPNKVKILQPE